MQLCIKLFLCKNNTKDEVYSYSRELQVTCCGLSLSAVHVSA